MELLETQDPEKRKLIETSERHKRELEKEVSEITARTEKMLTNVLIIGGSLALTYFLISGLSGRRSKRKKARKRTVHEQETDDDDDEVEKESFVTPTLISQIGSKLINQATLILLDIAREKLKEYLHPRKENDENS